MPFPMKIQPIDFNEPAQTEPVKPVVKSRLKRLFERQFLRNSAGEKVASGVDEAHFVKDGGSNGTAAEFEPSSVCLAKMVQNFIEESHEKQSTNATVPVRCCRNRCTCFNGMCNDSSEDEFDGVGWFGESNPPPSSGEATEILKSLVPCASVRERNLLADAARIVDRNKICKRKDDNCRKIVSDGLIALGYDASICKSRWDKSLSYPAGEYEYIDVIIEGERLLVDVDFRSEFEIARSTKGYRSILQTLPYIFVGKTDRLQKIISVVSDAAKQSLKKKGMHIPPWRKAEYVKAKWLSPHSRATPIVSKVDPERANEQPLNQSGSGDFQLSRKERNLVEENEFGESVIDLSSMSFEEEQKVATGKEWKPPEVKLKSFPSGVKMVTGLASIIDNEP